MKSTFEIYIFNWQDANKRNGHLGWNVLNKFTLQFTSCMEYKWKGQLLENVFMSMLLSINFILKSCKGYTPMEKKLLTLLTTSKV